MTREKLIEVMKAGAIAAGTGEPSWADCVTDAEWEAALLALEAAGVRMVPVEATGDMLMAGIESDAIQHPWQSLDVYRRMLAASPYAKQKDTTHESD